jgi:hypothetical protein
MRNRLTFWQNKLCLHYKIYKKMDEFELEYCEQDEAVYFVLDGERCSDFFSFEPMDDKGEHYLLVNMFSPAPGRGLGRAALELFIEFTGSKIHVRERWMNNSGDGSHVLPEAWAFVERMMAEGLIVSHDAPAETENCEDNL